MWKQNLETQGVLEKVTHSDLASPVVVVPKKDGQTRICGDYKVSLNPGLAVSSPQARGLVRLVVWWAMSHKTHNSW